MAIVTAMATASIAAATKLKRKQQHEASVHPDAFLFGMALHQEQHRLLQRTKKPHRGLCGFLAELGALYGGAPFEFGQGR